MREIVHLQAGQCGNRKNIIATLYCYYYYYYYYYYYFVDTLET